MTKITLYYADWCGHCKSFKPTWNALKSIFDKNNIEHAEYMDGKDDKLIKENNIEGFPTIHIQTNNKVYEYQGSREADAILHEVLPNLQKGGSQNNRFYITYTNL